MTSPHVAPPTPHIGAAHGEIAETVIMPGDPLRARFLAERYLQDSAVFNAVRAMYGATGTYQGKRVSVMGHGMGMPSIGIYSYELFRFYDVKQIIRVGTCGSAQAGVALRDLVIAMGACTDSNWQAQYGLPGHFAALASFDLLELAVRGARQLAVRFHVGNTASCDAFYSADSAYWKRWAQMGVLALEMEAAALYMNAAHLSRKALTILTVSDQLITGESLSSDERERAVTDMMRVALSVVEAL